MKFFLDHDVPAEVSRVLSQAGHDVRKVMEVMSPTTIDSEVLAYAIEHGRVLITCNRDDFLSLAARKDHAGIVIVIRRRTRIAECAALIRLLDRSGSQGIDGNINFA